MRGSLWPLVVVLGCGRSLPPALSLPTPSSGGAGEVDAPTTREQVLSLAIGRDPLLRSSRLPAADVLERIAGTEALREGAAALSAAELGTSNIARLQVVEDVQRGTEVTAIVRGTRLGIAERLLRDHGQESAAVLADLSPLLTRLRTDPQAQSRARHPLEALAPGRPLEEIARRTGERWVLSGWLDGPGIPLAPVARALAASPFDALREGPLGRVIVARAEGRDGPTEAGLADLRRATGLALQRVAADRHGEQGAWADTRRSVAEELGAEDPIAFLLTRAHERLVAAAARPAGAGGALLAATALRVIDACPDAPCSGLDRVETLLVAERWDPALGPIARTWTVIALKDALDTMEVGHSTVMFRSALVDLVDALLGSGAVAPTAGLLTRTTEEPTAWTLLGATVGDDRADTWDKVRIPLGRHLADEVGAALEGSDPAWRPLLERIAKRAVP